jgi:alkanesulfonate monooxygenase SsuD/methylene tetrahydromethanopterin reductase-like flavin-dependent oxidoreductase (luciferase family)
MRTLVILCRRTMTMATLEFGAWGSVKNYDIDEQYGGVAAGAYDEHIRQAKMMDELGYKYYWIIEHQASYVGAITSPTVFLTAIAAATERIRIGAMIWVLPFHNPIRLAEEIATLDHLSHGRVEFGTGIGTHEHEFMRLGLDYYARREMGDEALDIIEAAWTQSSVTYKGRFWNFDEMLARPWPYQKPHPPIWIAAHSMRAFEWAAERNYDVGTNISTDDQLVDKLAYFRKIWHEAQHPGPMPRQLLVRAVHVAETDEKARAEVEPYLQESMGLGAEMVKNTRIGMGTDPRGKGTDNTRYTRANGKIFAEARKSYDFWIDNGLAIVGSPETVARKLHASQERLGFTAFAANHHIGRMPTELVDKSITLFGKEVITAFDAPTEPNVPISLAGARADRTQHVGMAP